MGTEDLKVSMNARIQRRLLLHGSAQHTTFSVYKRIMLKGLIKHESRIRSNIIKFSFQPNMYFSKYNTIIKSKNAILIHNAITNAFIEVSSDLYHMLQNTPVRIGDFESDNEILPQLIETKILVTDDETEFLKIRHRVATRRYNPNYASFTILPTLDCNFSCPYCFESKQKKDLTTYSIDIIAKFINRITENKKEFNITWFGGEPLMAVKKMHSLYKQLNISNKSVDSSIITNGFLLNDSTIDILKTINVSTVQVTLDGTESSHNSRKKLSGNSHVNVFRKTINNIIKLSNEEFAQINIRVNIDNHNKQEFLPLYEYLAKEIPNFGKNVFVSPAFIADSPTKGCDKNEICVLSRKQISDFVVRLQKKHQFYHPLLYPSNILYECPVRNDNSWVICPDGSLFKCWEVVGIEDFKIGHLDENGEIVVTNESLLFQYMEGADPLSDKNCINCKTYPICGGGCVHARIMKKYHKAKVNPCAYAKNYLEKFLSAYYDIQAH